MLCDVQCIIDVVRYVRLAYIKTSGFDYGIVYNIYDITIVLPVNIRITF